MKDFTKPFTFLFGGSYPGCRFVASKYRTTGNKALQIVSDEEGPICVCSVNPPNDEVLGEDEIAIKDWSENSGMGNYLKIVGMIIREDPVRRIPSGFVEIPVYRLTPDGKKFFEKAA